MTITHGFDLPTLNRQPPYETIRDALKGLELPKLKDFESSAVTEIPGLFDWLVQLTGSTLDWIQDADQQEEIWALSSKCMAERCGRTAAPTRIRELHVTDEIVVELIEPSLTADLLGFKTWGSSLVLAKRLARHIETILTYMPSEISRGSHEGASILELGGGTGLCAIVLAKLGRDVVSTDLPEIVENMNKNIELNKVMDKAKGATLDWTQPELFAYPEKKFDMLLVSDPIYSPEHPQLVVNVIKRYMSQNGALCVQLPLRAKYEEERAKFYALLDSIGLQRLLHEEESGRDDFGEQSYAFSVWKSKKI